MRDVFCRSCGEQVGPTDNYCGKCGRHVSSQEVKRDSADTKTCEASREDQAAATKPQTAASLRAEGWLKVFCICLFAHAGNFYRVWRRSEADESVFASYPSLETAYFVIGIVTSAVVLYGGYVALQIWDGNPNGKKLAIRYLWIQLAAALACGVAAKLALSGLPAAYTRVAITQINIVFVVNVLFVATWMAYFKKSRRVRETYGG
jgi:hypothetical protein